MSKLFCLFRYPRAALSVLALAGPLAGFGSTSTEAAAHFQVFRESGAACLAESDCSLYMAAVPAGRRLEVEKVSCVIQLTGAGSEVETAVFAVLSAATTTFIEVLAPVKTADTATATMHAANHLTAFTVPAGQKLIARVESDGATGVFLLCSVSGELLP